MKSAWYFAKIALLPLKPGVFRKERLVEELHLLSYVHCNHVNIIFYIMIIELEKQIEL